MGLAAEMLPVQIHAGSAGKLSNQSVFGTGPSLAVEAWPLVSGRLGIGLFGQGGLGAMITDHGGSTILAATAGVQLKAAILPSLALVGKYAFGYRSASTSSRTTSAGGPATAGTTGYPFRLVAAGLSICPSGNHAGFTCHLGLDLRAGLELPSFEGGHESLPGYAAARVEVGSLSVGTSLVWNLPVQPLAPKGSIPGKRGWGMTVTLQKTWDYSSEGYLPEHASGGRLRRGVAGAVYLSAGAALLGGGLALDLVPSTAHDRALEPIDFVPVALYLVSAFAIGDGIYLLW